ncbi:MAG: hypothetical protein IPK13_06015 [Deltaproteobacteria bacterium]|nr:hypothetical protein [Deltaproteobacteria bacterium]
MRDLEGPTGARLTAKISVLARWIAAVGLLGLTACMPPSMRTVDDWLTAFEANDSATMVANTVPQDRALVAEALEALRLSASSTLALALPPQPLSHRIIDIEAKESDDRHRISVEVTLRNPLPFNSERVGQSLDIPRIRSHLRRFLVVRQDGHWGVKLDLAATLERARFVAEFEQHLSRAAFDAAEAMLLHIPEPPDEANALKTVDRLETTLREDLKQARHRSDQAAIKKSARARETQALPSDDQHAPAGDASRSEGHTSSEKSDD